MKTNIALGHFEKTTRELNTRTRDAQLVHFEQMRENGLYECTDITGDLREWNTNNIEGTRILRAVLKKQNIQHARIDLITFLHCDLTGVDFTGTIFTHTSFYMCNLSGAILKDCRFNETNFLLCDLYSANLTHTNIQPEQLALCNVGHAKMQGTVLAPIARRNRRDYITLEQILPNHEG